MTIVLYDRSPNASCLTERGERDRHDCEAGMRWTGVARLTKRATSGRPKSCHPHATPCVGAALSDGCLVQREPDAGIVPGMVRESPWIGHQGCHEASRNTTACGTPDDSGDSDLSGAPPLPTTASASGPRVHRAPGVPHALSFSRAGMQHPSDAHAPRERATVSQ